MPVTSKELEDAIRAAIQVIHVKVEDDSGGCGEKYAVLIVSKEFEGKTTLARHRMVNEVLKTQIAQIHAFTQATCEENIDSKAVGGFSKGIKRHFLMFYLGECRRASG